MEYVLSDQPYKPISQVKRAGAPEARETEVAALEIRLEKVRDHLQGCSSRISGALDRLAGPVPNAVAGENAKVGMNCSLSRLLGLIDEISELAVSLSHSADRFDNIV